MAAIKIRSEVVSQSCEFALSSLEEERKIKYHEVVTNVVDASLKQMAEVYYSGWRGYLFRYFKPLTVNTHEIRAQVEARFAEFARDGYSPDGLQDLDNKIFTLKSLKRMAEYVGAGEYLNVSCSDFILLECNLPPGA